MLTEQAKHLKKRGNFKKMMERERQERASIDQARSLALDEREALLNERESAIKEAEAALYEREQALQAKTDGAKTKPTVKDNK